MKIKSIRIITVITLGVIILTQLWMFITFQNRDVYYKMSNGDLISRSGVVYQLGGEIPGYDGKDVEAEKVIGRIGGEKFYQLISGTSIWKVKGHDKQDVILEKALMWEGVYTRKENVKTEMVFREDPKLYKQRLHYWRHDYKEVLDFVAVIGRGITGSVVKEVNPPILLYVPNKKAVSELIDELTFNFNKIPLEKADLLKNLLYNWVQKDYTDVNEYLKMVEEGLKSVEAELKDVESGKTPNYGLNGRQTSEVLVMMEATAYSHEASLRDKKNPPYNTFNEEVFAEIEDKLRNHSNFTTEQRTAMLEMLAEWNSGNISNAVQQHKQLVTWLRNDRLILKETK